jgi:hypothetical protein
MTGDTTGQSVSLELYVRSLAPRAGHAQQEALIRRLEELDATDRIDEYSVTVWGRRVSLSSAAAETDAGQFVLDRVEAFRDWARRSSRSVDSFFETHRVESSLTDEEYVALVLPAVVLAEYRDGELAYVAPCSDGGTATTPADQLDHLESSPVLDSDPLGNRGGADQGPDQYLTAEDEE